MRKAAAQPALLAAILMAAGLLQARETDPVPPPSLLDAAFYVPAPLSDEQTGPHDASGDPVDDHSRHAPNPAEIELSIQDLSKSNRLPSTDPSLEPHVQKALKFYRTRARPSIQGALQRESQYGPSIRSSFAREEVPEWLAGLAMVESHFNPRARSPYGYAGMWQMSADTARSLGLKVSKGLDERLDPVKSSEAVARLLARHYRAFQDWDLALAAYAAGEMRVKRALAQRPGADLEGLVRRGLLPERLIQSVASVKAASRIIESPEAHGFRSVGRTVGEELVADSSRSLEALSGR